MPRGSKREGGKEQEGGEGNAGAHARKDGYYYTGANEDASQRAHARHTDIITQYYTSQRAHASREGYYYTVLYKLEGTCKARRNILLHNNNQAEGHTRHEAGENIQTKRKT